MAVALKGKRKIIVRDRTFYWWIKDDPDGASMLLHVLSPDKRYLIRYAVGQAKAHSLKWSEQWPPPFVEVLGSEFGGLQPEGCWRRVRTPVWEDDTVITPAFVQRLIEWSLDEEKEVVLTDSRGEAVKREGGSRG